MTAAVPRQAHRVPAPPLDAFVASIWYYENPPVPNALERVLPNGAASLIVNLKEDQTRVYRPGLGYRCETASGAIFCGLSSRYCLIDKAEQECVLGVSFRPGGSLPFFRVPPRETLDVHVSLEALWGRRGAARLRERLLEAPVAEAKLDAMECALAEAWRPAGLHPAVEFALGTFDRRPGETSIAEVTARIGLSAKRFIERFKREVGMAPKRYNRILRFQRALAHAEKGISVDWTRIAVDCGYFDQAHFIHDFRSFSGITPTAYQAARTEFRNHVKFLQSAAVSA